MFKKGCRELLIHWKIHIHHIHEWFCHHNLSIVLRHYSQSSISSKYLLHVCVSLLKWMPNIAVYAFIKDTNISIERLNHFIKFIASTLFIYTANPSNTRHTMWIIVHIRLPFCWFVLALNQQIVNTFESIFPSQYSISVYLFFFFHA